MKRLFMITVLLPSHLVLAGAVKDQYAIELSGSYYLALPKTLEIALKREESRKLPSCTTLSKDLEPMLAAIEQCGDPSSKKDEFCKYTVRLARQKILGIKSEITQAREADAKQLWSIAATLPNSSSANLSALATELNIVNEQLPAPVTQNSQLRRIETNTSRSKLLSLLAKLDDQELTGIQFRDPGDGNFNLVTTSRAVTCELIAGNISLQLESDIAGSFEVPADQTRMTKLWEMKKALDPLVGWRAKQDRFKYIVAGHRLASMEDQDHPEDIEKNVLADAEILIDVVASEFKLVLHKNKFTIGQRLPQTKVESHYLLKQLWDAR